MSTHQELNELFYNLSESFMNSKSIDPFVGFIGTTILKKSKFKKLCMSFYEWHSVDFEYISVDEEYYSDENDIARIPTNEKEFNNQDANESLNVNFFENLRLENKRKIINSIEEAIIKNS